MRIELMSLPVSDQRAALRFYAETLGFVKRQDVPLGDDAWLTVVSPEQPNCCSNRRRRLDDTCGNLVQLISVVPN